MGSEAESIIVPFLGALQASVAVLLTIFFGVIAAQFNLISEASAKDVSKACVKLFLPALLIVNVGSQLHQDTVSLTTLPMATADSHSLRLLTGYQGHSLRSSPYLGHRL